MEPTSDRRERVVNAPCLLLAFSDVASALARDHPQINQCQISPTRQREHVETLLFRPFCQPWTGTSESMHWQLLYQINEKVTCINCGLCVRRRDRMHSRLSVLFSLCDRIVDFRLLIQSVSFVLFNLCQQIFYRLLWGCELKSDILLLPSLRAAI